MSGSTTETKLIVEVRVFATLRPYLPELGIGEPRITPVEPGTTLGELRDLLGLPVDQVKVIMRNNLQAFPDEIIADGDRITYIPAVAGG
ncbi:MAG: MoaD/ThiS family protein [Anaerolineales bacterium]|nr:MoaD/ThiS family protein [Anaerolineales bacterium]